MFKNMNSKRITCILLALVLVTSLFIGGSIARYVTNTSSEDEARVAVWGINTGGEEMDLFKNQYKLEDDTIIALSANEDNIIAPGLGGMSEFKIIEAMSAGLAPEVRYEVIIDLDDSEIADEIKNHPGIEWKVDNGEWGTWDEFKTSLLSLSGDASGYKVYAPGVMADEFANGKTHTVAWQWILDSGNDELDTILGNKTADGEDITAKLVITITARQTDGSTVGMINYDTTYNMSYPSVMTFRSVADYNTFNGVKINGTTLTENEEYTKEPGSIIVKLKESYLSTLEKGDYNIEILSTDETKTAKATFKVIDEFDISKVDTVLANNSWETISKVTKLGKANEIWSIGDKTTVDVNGTDYEVRIIGFNHDGDNTITFMFTNKISPQAIGLENSAINDTHTSVGGWIESKMRKEKLPILLEQMENKNLIKEVEKLTLIGYPPESFDSTTSFNWDTIKTNDKLFLLSYTEVFPNSEYGYGKNNDLNKGHEGNQYKWFEINGTSLSTDYWLRTPSPMNAHYYVGADGSFSENGSASHQGLIPAFVIG